MSEPMTLSQINDLRARVAAGEPVSDEEIHGVVVRLSEERMTAKPQQRGKGTKVEPKSLLDLNSGGEDDS